MGTLGWVIYVVVIIAMFYFLGVRPQQKEKKKMQDLMSSLAVGDTVLTTSGFYGVIIDLTEDTVIVEFGGNKNCRIPMQKAAIVQIEKASN
nr:preprotein translocase subunit YajC [uncultured Oribacterium sp.]